MKKTKRQKESIVSEVLAWLSSRQRWKQLRSKEIYDISVPKLGTPIPSPIAIGRIRGFFSRKELEKFPIFEGQSIEVVAPGFSRLNLQGIIIIRDGTRRKEEKRRIPLLTGEFFEVVFPDRSCRPSVWIGEGTKLFRRVLFIRKEKVFSLCVGQSLEPDTVLRR